MGTNTPPGTGRHCGAPRAGAHREIVCAGGWLRLQAIATLAGGGNAPNDVIVNRSDVFHSLRNRDIP